VSPPAHLLQHPYRPFAAAEAAADRHRVASIAAALPIYRGVQILEFRKLPHPDRRFPEITVADMMFSAAASLALRPVARMVPSTARVSRATFATMSGNPTAKCTTSMGEFKVELVRPPAKPCITASAVPWRQLP
jgi:hypothetical protein